MYAIFFDGEFKFKFTCFCLCSLKNRETKSFLRFFFFTPRSHAAESLPGFIVDNHKDVFDGGGGGEGGAEGLGWDLPEV